MLAAAATCQRFGVSYVLSEDLDDGQDYAGVRVENPFRGELLPGDEP
jgi:predicted nucleic acid-binding protein